MLFLIGSGLFAGIVTIAAAWLLTSRYPHLSARAQTFRAAMSFPLFACMLFAALTAFTLVSGDGADPALRQATGMVIFSFTFFLIYALAIGCIIGWPMAIVAVRRFRGG